MTKRGEETLSGVYLSRGLCSIFALFFVESNRTSSPISAALFAINHAAHGCKMAEKKSKC